MKGIKSTAVVFFALVCVTLAACWDARELSATAIVLGVGIDETGDRLQLTAELCGADSSEASVLQATGGSMEDCVKGLSRLLEEDLFWGGTAAVIYGSGVDGEKADECGMYLYRKLGVSGKTPVLRAWDCQAADVLGGNYAQAPYVSMALGEALQLRSRSSAEIMTLLKQLEAAQGQSGQGRSAVVGVNGDSSVILVDGQQ